MPDLFPGICLRGQGSELQLGSGHQCGEQICIRLPTPEGPSPGHQQDTDGRCGRKLTAVELSYKFFHMEKI